MDGNDIVEVKAKFDFVPELLMVEQAEEKYLDYINGIGFQGYNNQSF